MKMIYYYSKLSVNTVLLRFPTNQTFGRRPFYIKYLLSSLDTLVLLGLNTSAGLDSYDVKKISVK